MTPIVIATELTRQDWQELRIYTTRHAQTVTSWRDRIISVLAIAVLATAFFAFLQSADTTNTLRPLLFGAILGIVAFALLQWFRAARFRDIEPVTFVGTVRYELDEHGIRTSRAGMSGYADWNRIAQIDETVTTIYLTFDPLTAFVIPKRYIDAALLPNVIAQLRAWHADRTRAAPGEQPAPFVAATDLQAAPPSSVLVTRDAAEDTPRPRAFLRDLFGNLRAGFKVLIFSRVRLAEFTVSFDQLAALLAIVIGLLIGLGWLTAEPDTTFDAYGFYAWVCYLVAGLWACALIARVHGAQASTRALLVILLAAVPAAIVVLTLILLLPLGKTAFAVAFICAGILLFAVTERAVSIAFGRTRLLSRLLILLAVVGIPWTFQAKLYMDPQLWYASESDDGELETKSGARGAESILFEQADRIADVVGSTAPQRPDIADTWFVGFAGDGAQSVFRNEALYAEKVFGRKFGTGRALGGADQRPARSRYVSVRHCFQSALRAAAHRRAHGSATTTCSCCGSPRTARAKWASP